MARGRLHGIFAGALFLALLPACDGSRPAPPRGGPFTPDIAPATIPPTPLVTCTAARASESLRPRADLLGIITPGTGGATLVHTSDLFARFRAICGGCHVDASNGGRHVDESTFATVFDQNWFVHIKSDDPTMYMPPPPNGKPFSSRDASDPVVELATYLEAWLAQGRPADMFMLDTGSATTPAATGSYGFTPDVAAAMSNLGNCVPNQAAFARSAPGVMEARDAFFAGADALPPSLADTDLTTFDSSELAAVGVVAYVPAYPLWSAGSGKLRHIRVPKGQSIRFDKATQSFDIPANTRFYKTFFRKVLDRAGIESNRKMETRLIVARPDRTLPDGTVEQTALFGTYVWSEDETTATLGNLRYRDGTTFADQLRTYVTDELTYQELANAVPPGADLEQALAAAVAEQPGLEQHYAIPGRIRCVQCHMGSPSQNFVLGFFPLQIARRANGTGGTYEPTGDDELSQLQRLIDYGVISGMASPADVLPLEASQGARKPRTDGELNAQAYMVGNCAHCHNPRGLPSVTKPELLTALNFMPSDTDGGVFQMSLERMSPIRARGANGDIPIPYITPSLRDYPVTDVNLARMDNQAAISTVPSTSAFPTELTWSPKYDASEMSCSGADDDRTLRSFCGSRRTGFSFVAAPWRSLIYRNVDTPFPYFDDYVPFPHMPMNTFGFDCRAPRIMGDWMVGLPAVRKFPDLREDGLPVSAASPGAGSYDPSAQPYQEVTPGDPGYDDAVARARSRLDEYHASVRYNYCEEVLSPDIFDPITPATSAQYRPNPIASPGGYLFGYNPPFDPTHPGEYVQPAIGVPYHSHFFNYDPTDAPPPWSPRRADWRKILVDGEPDTALPAGGVPLDDALQNARRILVDAVNEASLTAELRSYATSEIPFGLWQVKPACADKLGAQKKVSDFAVSRPLWMDRENPPPDAPVYVSTPGAMLYRHICFNCHGPRADGRGLQADALAASSEGEARPANFHEGLFGPSTQPGANLLSAFSLDTVPADMTTALGWGSRYMAWMTLGGTLKKIPQDIIHQVEATKIFGQTRQNLGFLPGANQTTANMLNLAKGLCSVVLPDTDTNFYYYRTYRKFPGGSQPEFYPPFNAADSPFISSNGDKEMWIRLCSRYSPPVVRVYSATGVDGDVKLSALYYADGYPADAPVLDHNQVTRMGVQPDNYYPACLQRPTDDAVRAWLDGTAVGKTMPYCPSAPTDFLGGGKVMWRDGNAVPAYLDNIARWELRGAIAAGMAVFSHLQGGGAQTQVPPYYNECQLLR